MTRTIDCRVQLKIKIENTGSKIKRVLDYDSYSFSSRVDASLPAYWQQFPLPLWLYHVSVTHNVLVCWDPNINGPPFRTQLCRLHTTREWFGIINFCSKIIWNHSKKIKCCFYSTFGTKPMETKKKNAMNWSMDTGSHHPTPHATGHKQTVYILSHNGLHLSIFIGW